MFDDGDLDAGVVVCGQCVGMIDEVLPAGEIVRRVIEEAARIRDHSL